MLDSHEPFELVQSTAGRKVLRLHGTKDAMVSIDESGVCMLLHAFRQGWDIDLQSVHVHAPIDLSIIVADLVEDFRRPPPR